MDTTQFIKKSKPTVEQACHGGEGSFIFGDLIAKADKLFIKFIHDDIILPHSSFGCHKHLGPDIEEWYYCVSGSGIIQLDGKEMPFEPGDICVCRGGGNHGLINNTDEDLRIFVVCATAKGDDTVWRAYENEKA